MNVKFYGPLFPIENALTIFDNCRAETGLGALQSPAPAPSARAAAAPCNAAPSSVAGYGPAT